MKKKKDKVIESIEKGETTMSPNTVEEYSEITGKTEKWEVQNVETKADRPLADDGTGLPIILRCFEFKFNPTLKGRPTKEQIITPEYVKKLKDRLWLDELELIQDPRVVIEKDNFKIFATCQAKKGSLIFKNGMIARPDVLQDALQPHGTR